MSKHNYDIDHYCGQDAAGVLTFPIFIESYYDSARRVRADRARVSIGGVEFVFESETPDRLIRIDREVPSYMLHPDPVRKLRDAFEHDNYLKKQMDGLRDKSAELQAQLDDALENERAAEGEVDFLRRENEKLKERDNQPGATYWEDRWRRARASYEKQLAVLRQTIEDLKVDKEHYRAVAMAADVAKVGIFDEQEIDVTQFRHRPAHGKARSFKIPQHRPIQYTALIRKPYLKRRPWWKFIFCRKDK